MSLIDEAKKKDPDAFGQLVQENLQPYNGNTKRKEERVSQ